MPSDGPTPKPLEDLEAEMTELLGSYRLAEKTERQYDKCWAAFETWCASVGRPSLPADGETVAAYLAEAVPGRYGDSHVGVVLAAIAERHRRAGHPPPGQELAKAARAGMARVDGRPARRPRVLTADLAELAARAAPAPSVATLRARALLLVGHAGEVPHAQLCRLGRSAVERIERSRLLAVPANTGYRRHMTAKTVELAPTGGELCPVAALDALLAATASSHPLAGPGVLPALRTAAALAGVELTFDPYPAHGLGPTDLWRLATCVSRDHAIFLRDRAYVLLLHAGPFEMSEPLRLRGRDLAETADGLLVHLPWAKPDRFGRREYVAIPRAPEPAVCPVAAVAEWRRLARIGADDWLFFSLLPGRQGPLRARSAHESVRRLAARAGLGPVAPGDLRRGFFVSAREAGQSLLSVTMATRVKRLETAEAICAAAPPARRRAPRELGL